MFYAITIKGDKVRIRRVSVSWASVNKLALGDASLRRKRNVTWQSTKYFYFCKRKVRRSGTDIHLLLGLLFVSLGCQLLEKKRSSLNVNVSPTITMIPYERERTTVEFDTSAQNFIHRLPFLLTFLNISWNTPLVFMWVLILKPRVDFNQKESCSLQHM